MHTVVNRSKWQSRGVSRFHCWWLQVHHLRFALYRSEKGNFSVWRTYIAKEASEGICRRHLLISKSIGDESWEKFGGLLVFKEPLWTNPLFTLYRYLTPWARTVHGRPFTSNDLRLMSSFSDLQTLHRFGFTNIARAFFRSSKLSSLFTNIDEIISTTPFRFMYWQFSGIAVVKK